MNKKSFISVLLTVMLLFGFAVPVFAEENDSLILESRSALLMDAATGTILFEKNSHDAMPPASVTKIMTLLLPMMRPLPWQNLWQAVRRPLWNG